MTEAEKIEALLVKRIEKAYKTALKDIIRQNKSTLRKFGDVMSGKIQPPAIYTTTGREAEWREGFIKQLFRQENLIDKIRTELNRVGGRSTQYIQQSMVGSYMAQRNATISLIEDGAGMRVGFGALNRQAVQNAVDSYVENAPFTKIAFRNLGQNTKVVERLQNELAVSIANGEGIRDLTGRITAVVGDAGYNARRTAQTESTRIRNEAFIDTEAEAADMGIEIENEWSCQMIPPDKYGRGGSRDTHIDLDGTLMPQGEVFVLSDGDELRYPGDPRGKACNVINCHCTLIPHVMSVGRTQTGERARFAVGGGTAHRTIAAAGRMTR